MRDVDDMMEAWEKGWKDCRQAMAGEFWWGYVLGFMSAVAGAVAALAGSGVIQ